MSDTRKCFVRKCCFSFTDICFVNKPGRRLAACGLPSDATIVAYGRLAWAGLPPGPPSLVSLPAAFGRTPSREGLPGGALTNRRAPPPARLMHRSSRLAAGPPTGLISTATIPIRSRMHSHTSSSTIDSPVLHADTISRKHFIYSISIPAFHK